MPALIVEVHEHRRYYDVDGTATNALLLLDIAGDEKRVQLNEISNSPFERHDWDRVLGAFHNKSMAPPLKKEATKKAKQVEKYRTWVKDEADIMAQVRAKKALRQQSAFQSGRLTVADRIRLETERDSATESGNAELARRLNSQLEALAVTQSNLSFSGDSMATVNERNRKANREEIRRAELASAEERKRVLKALEAGEDVKMDPSARVRINPKLTYEKSNPASRSMTPQPYSQEGLTNGSRSPISAAAATSTATAAKTMGTPTRFDDMVKQQIKVDLDLGDF